MNDPAQITALLGTADEAATLDEQDSLAHFRRRFSLPATSTGTPLIYLCGHSLGPAPRAALDLVSEELADWSRLGVLGHHTAQRPWIDYHNFLTRGLQHVAGAHASEVIAMNSLTVNLHLMLASFYRPTRERHRILLEDGAFSSDYHAIASQIGWHGYAPSDSIISLAPRAGEETLRTEDVLAAIERHGRELALVLWPGVQYRTGQAFECQAIAAAARRVGAVIGFDMAHAIGNLPLSLHDWNADFAVWCSYKYLNAGPGAVGGCFVHERHVARHDLPRLAGWWGHDPATRFQMLPNFHATPTAAGWAVSNPPVLSSAPLIASLDIFREADISELRAKSLRLTQYLVDLIARGAAGHVAIVTPDNPTERGCQVSLRVLGGPNRGRRVFATLSDKDIVCDWREPDIIRVALAPLYNSFLDAYLFAARFAASVRETT